MSAQAEQLKANGIQVQLHIECETTATTPMLKAFALILEDSEHAIEVLNGRMTRIE